LQLHHKFQLETDPVVAGAIVRDFLPAEADLSVRGLTKHFGSTQILRDVSFSVAKGSVVALIGAN
jgi:ABC-type polysaccharide/polyol phosphate transport system ATPase subunit